MVLALFAMPLTCHSFGNYGLTMKSQLLSDSLDCLSPLEESLSLLHNRWQRGLRSETIIERQVWLNHPFGDGRQRFAVNPAKDVRDLDISYLHGNALNSLRLLVRSLGSISYCRPALSPIACSGGSF